MSTPYVRRPVLEGNTDVPVQAQPYLQGTVRKTSAGIVPGFAALVATANADLVIESEAMGGGPTTVTFAAGHSDLLADILTTINAGVSGTATAVERDGCIRLQTVGVGETVLGVKSFIRVHPATTDYDADGVPNDCAALFGFACYPDPAATVTAGDIESAATRPVEQGNLPGTRFVARGEDRTSSAFNRALAQLALNADITRTAAIREAYYPVALTVDFSDPNWDVASGRLRFDGSGRVTQIKLSDLDAVNAQLSGRLYVGGLSRSSTLREISKYWGVTDSSGKELLVYDDTNSEIRTLRVGAVTRGESGFGRPDFADEISAPAVLFADTADVAPDGANVLGVARLKQPTTAITGINGKTNVVCSSLSTPGAVPTTPTAGVGFLTHGISRGDIAVVSDATVTSPFCHNGNYYVEDVISEQELILRPLSDTDVESLNPSESGTFGNITIYSSGEWSSDIWVTFDPPLPRFPEDNQIVLTFGIERETLNQREDEATSYTDTSSVQRTPSDPQLTGFQAQQFWQRQSLGGAYAGMSADRTADAGSVIKARKRPVTIVAPEKTAPSAGTYVRGAFSGTLLSGGILVAEHAAVPPHPDTFTLSDVGRVVKLTGGALLDLEPFLISEFIDGSHVRLAPLGAAPGGELPSYGVVDYEVYDDVVDYPGALLSLVAPDEDRDGNALADVGVLYVREQNNASAPPAMPTREHGRSLLHLERVSVGYVSPGTATSIRTVVITGATATTVTVGVGVESFQNIFAVEGGDTRPVEAPYNGGSVFRILNGPNAGFYLIQKTTSANELTLRTLDGGSVLLDTSVPTTQIGAFYNAHVSVGHKLAGTGYGDVAYRTAKLRVFFDSLEQGEASGVGVSLDWRGSGAGITAQLNDADFVAYDSEAGATGYVVDVQAYAPLTGVIRASLTSDKNATDVAKRTVRGSTLWTLSNSVDFLLDDSTETAWWAGTPEVDRENLLAWNTWLHQEGSDPTLIVTRGSGGSDADLPVGAQDAGFPSSRAMMVVRDLSLTTTGIWGALDVLGAVYQQQTAEGLPGVYTEAGVGAGRWAAPIHKITQDNSDSSSLGLPDTVWAPESSSGIVFLDSPDFSKFSIPHVGVFRIDGVTFTQREALIGQRAYTLESGGKYRTIVGVLEDAGDTYLAVEDSTSRTAISGVSDRTNNFRIVGNRWSQAYLHVAEFFRVGTAVTTGYEHIAKASTPYTEFEKLPVVGTGLASTFDALNETAYEGYWSADLWPHAQGILHPRSTLFGSSTEGSVASALGSAVSAIYDQYEEYDSGYPIPAFPNANVISNYAGASSGVTIDGIDYPRTLNDVYYGGNLGNHDFCLVLQNQLFTHGVSAAWDNSNGGVIRVAPALDSAGLSPTTGSEPFHVVELRQRGVTDVSYAAGTYRAHIRYVVRNRTTGALLSNTDVGVQFYIRGSESNVYDNEAFHYNTSLTRAVSGDITTAYREIFFTGVEKEQVGVFSENRSVAALEDAFHFAVSLYWTDAQKDAEIWILDFGIQSLALPLQVNGPLRAAGTVSAPDFLYTGTRRGFVTVAPSQIGWLNSSEFFQHKHSSAVPSENGYYFSQRAAYMGVGSVKGTTNFDDTTGLPISSAVFRPLPAAAALFTNGVYGATFRTLQPFYDPVWYLQSGDIDFEASQSTPCGPTGFMIPIDVPHGARITGIDLIAEVTKSIVAWNDPLPEPRVDDPGDPTTVGMTYQFYVPDQFAVPMHRDMEGIYSNGYQNSLKDMSTWTRGFRVRLWRYRNASIYASKFGDPVYKESGDRQISAGWPESIWSRTVELDGTVSTDPGDTIPEPELLDLSWDLFRDADSTALDVDSHDFRDLTADRRSYSYFFTVEFYAGARAVSSSSSYALYQAEFAYFFSPLTRWFGGNTQAPTSSPQDSFYGTGWYYGAGFDINEAEPGDTLDSVVSNYKIISVDGVDGSGYSLTTSAAYVPGTFTIRGFRLTYETDKPRN